MGGQACVSYGAAEFSRDLDLAIVASVRNLEALRGAMTELRGEVIAVPPFEAKYLRKGHAVHFRCHHPEADDLRVDVMSRMRGVEPFAKLWRRRTTVELPDGGFFDLLSLPDLVQAKKTQRDKDWPMIRRLVEADFFGRRDTAGAADVRFWLRELRTPELLIAVAAAHPAICRRLLPRRRLLRLALRGEERALAAAIVAEESKEREADRRYWHRCGESWRSSVTPEVDTRCRSRRRVMALLEDLGEREAPAGDDVVDGDGVGDVDGFAGAVDADALPLWIDDDDGLGALAEPVGSLFLDFAIVVVGDLDRDIGRAIEEFRRFHDPLRSNERNARREHSVGVSRYLKADARIDAATPR